MRRLIPIVAALVTACAQQPTQPPAPAAKSPSSAEILAAAPASDWRPIDPENTIYVDLPGGRVVIELAPAFAPNHVANIKALAREKYFDGLAVVRSQENYVVQWGDPEEDDKKRKPIGSGKSALPGEFARPLTHDLPFTKLKDGDVYAPEVGHSNGFPAARDVKSGQAWLTHCYAMVGAGRGATADSGSGAELYVVIGHSPRHLDRNVTLVGRVVKGMEILSTLPRGTEALGFYKEARQRIPLRSIRVAADVPEKDRLKLEELRTDTPTWDAFVDARRWRREDWFLDKVGHVEVCNVPIPVREAK